MINSIPYYPYQQNVQILKGFFSKPLTLICAKMCIRDSLFGGDRPSQTAHLTMSPDQIHGHRLEFQ